MNNLWDVCWVVRAGQAREGSGERRGGPGRGGFHQHRGRVRQHQQAIHFFLLSLLLRTMKIMLELIFGYLICFLRYWIGRHSAYCFYTGTKKLFSLVVLFELKFITLTMRLWKKKKLNKINNLFFLFRRLLLRCNNAVNKANLLLVCIFVSVNFILRFCPKLHYCIFCKSLSVKNEGYFDR